MEGIPHKCRWCVDGDHEKWWSYWICQFGPAALWSSSTDCRDRRYTSFMQQKLWEARSEFSTIWSGFACPMSCFCITCFSWCRCSWVFSSNCLQNDLKTVFFGVPAGVSVEFVCLSYLTAQLSLSCCIAPSPKYNSKTTWSLRRLLDKSRRCLVVDWYHRSIEQHVGKCIFITIKYLLVHVYAGQNVQRSVRIIFLSVDICREQRRGILLKMRWT